MKNSHKKLIVIVTVLIGLVVLSYVAYSVLRKSSLNREETGFARAAQIIPEIRDATLAETKGVVVDMKGCGYYGSGGSDETLSCIISMAITYDVTDEAQAKTISARLEKSFHQAELKDPATKPVDTESQNRLVVRAFDIDGLACTYEHLFFKKIDTTGMSGVAPMTTPYGLSVEARCSAVASKAYYPMMQSNDD